MSLRLFSSFIIKAKNPCINCKNYIKYKHRYTVDELYESSDTRMLSKCTIFGKENLITGEVEYTNVVVCRENKTMCGKDGIYFIEKHVKNKSNLDKENLH